MPKGIPKRADDQTLEGGVGGVGGYSSKGWPQAINTKTPAQERAQVRERELIAERKREQANAKNEADYAERKARGEIKSAFERPENMAKGGKVGSASKRADGIAQRGKTRGTMVMCGGGRM